MRARVPDGLHLARAGGGTGRAESGGREDARAGMGAGPAAVEAGYSGICGIAGPEDSAQWLLIVILRDKESVCARGSPWPVGAQARRRSCAGVGPGPEEWVRHGFRTDPSFV